jgi:hypothetical protein
MSKERQIVGDIESAPRNEGTGPSRCVVYMYEGGMGIYKYIVGFFMSRRMWPRQRRPAIEHFKLVASVDSHIAADVPGHPSAWSSLSVGAQRAHRMSLGSLSV